MSFNYESWLKQAEERLTSLQQKRAGLDDEIARLKEGITAISPLRKRATLPDGAGLTKLIKNVFRTSAGQTLAPTEVRDALIHQGEDLPQTNPMSNIHQVLKRLAQAGEIEPIRGPGTKRGYRLNPRLAEKSRHLTRTPAVAGKELNGSR